MGKVLILQSTYKCAVGCLVCALLCVCGGGGGNTAEADETVTCGDATDGSGDGGGCLMATSGVGSEGGKAATGSGVSGSCGNGDGGAAASQQWRG